MSSDATNRRNYTQHRHETPIRLSINFDGTGDSEISTRVSFFDHMLTLFARQRSVRPEDSGFGRPGRRPSPHRGRRRHLSRSSHPGSRRRQTRHHSLRQHDFADGRNAGDVSAGSQRAIRVRLPSRLPHREDRRIRYGAGSGILERGRVQRDDESAPGAAPRHEQPPHFGRHVQSDSPGPAAGDHDRPRQPGVPSSRRARPSGLASRCGLRDRSDQRTNLTDQSDLANAASWRTPECAGGAARRSFPVTSGETPAVPISFFTCARHLVDQLDRNGWIFHTIFHQYGSSAGLQGLLGSIISYGNSNSW